MGLMKNLKRAIVFDEPNVVEPFVLSDDSPTTEYDARNDNNQLPTDDLVSENIIDNENYIKERFDYPKNSDIVVRKLIIGKRINVFLLFIDGMVNTEFVDLGVIQPLLQLPELLDMDLKNLPDTIEHRLICHNQITRTQKMQDIIDGVNFGTLGIFIDGCDVAFSLDVRSWGHRSIDRPENEQSIYGPQEAFAEMLRNNTALIRKTLKTEKLICENVNIGTVSKTSGVIMYISDIANDKLVDEVRRRINSIAVDYIISIEEVAMMIEEKTFMVTSQILSTERPDRAARALSEGRVVLVINGSPRALIMPTNAFELMHTASDAYMRVPYANMTRIVRLLAMFVSLLLPGLYLAITLYHQEMIPTDLLFSISASRENVPFPSIVEILLMELSFEMIREAGIRMPGPIGSTLGIVGGLILGQAAVSAKIVSPIMIIVIAVTGIGSFATTNYSLGWAYRVLRIGFIALGATSGFYGISLGIFVYAVFIAAQKSFGMPFLSPIPNDKSDGTIASVFVKPIWKQENRPEYLATKKQKREQKISRKWNIK